MSHSWKIEHATCGGMTDVTIRNVRTRHIPLRLRGPKDEKNILVQLLRHAGYSEAEYPYQSYHSNHGWGPKVEGLGIIIARRFRHEEVPGNGTFYGLAAETENKLQIAARHYLPFAQYFASPASRPELSAIGEAVDQLREATVDDRAKIECLRDRTTGMVDEIAELRGNVGELINRSPSDGDIEELREASNSRLRRLESRSETVYETLYHSANGVLSRVGSLEGSRQNTIDLPRRLEALERTLWRLVTTLNDDPGTQTNYTATIYAPDADELYEEQIEREAFEEREAERAGEVDKTQVYERDLDVVPF